MDNSCSALVTDLVRLAPHTEVAHHIPGRIRLKILPSGIKMALKSDLLQLEGAIPGIHSIEVKWLARCVVIAYDERRLPFEFWDRLQQIKDKPELAGEIEKVLCTNSRG